MNTGEALKTGFDVANADALGLWAGGEGPTPNTLCAFGIGVLTFLERWQVGGLKQWVVKLVAGWLRGYLQGQGCLPE